MRKSLLKVFSILVVSLMLILFTTYVNAADTNTGFNDISYTLSGNNTAGNNTTGNNTSGNNTTGNDTGGQEGESGEIIPENPITPPEDEED